MSRLKKNLHLIQLVQWPSVICRVVLFDAAARRVQTFRARGCKMSGFPYNSPSFVSRPAGHAVATRKARGPFGPEETQNAQDEDQIGREKALQIHRDGKDQDSPGG